MFQYAVITAPFTGVVTKRYANKRLIDSSRNLIADSGHAGGPAFENDLLRLALPVPESAVPLIHLGGAGGCDASPR